LRRPQLNTTPKNKKTISMFFIYSIKLIIHFIELTQKYTI